MNTNQNLETPHLNYIVYTLIVLLIGLPLCSQGMAFACLLLVESSTWFSRDLMFDGRVFISRDSLITLTYWFSTAVFCFGILMLGHLYGKYVSMPKRFVIRNSLFAISIIYTLVVSAFVLSANGADILGYHPADILFLAFLSFFIANVSLSFNDPQAFLLLIFLTYALFSIGVFLTNKQRYFDEPWRGVYRFSVVVTCLFLMGLCGYFIARNNLTNLTAPVEKQEIISEVIVFDNYHPFSRGNLLTRLRQPATLTIDQDHPKLGGASPLYPLYASAVNNLYKGNIQSSEVASVGSTSQAYQRLISGDVDVIFATAPSEYSKRLARERGITLNLTPLAKEGLVFFVNKNNPVDGLTLTQIRDIYSGRLSNWRSISGISTEIKPFQRPISSGSRIVMEAKVMSQSVVKPPERINAPTEAVADVAQGSNHYHNYINAIGYSFRYYAVQEAHFRQIKLLAIDGIQPSLDNIGTDRYPYNVDIYMVTTGEISDNTQKLMTWFLSEQGQSLVEDVGYVPIK